MRVSSARTPSIGCNILWDGEATIRLITLKKAREMGLVGNPIKMAVIKVGGEKQELKCHAIKKSTAEIDIIIGFEYARFHSFREQSYDHLLVLGNRFGKLYSWLPFFT